jgi:tRNA pseudouridine38-40 synthase
VLRTEQRVATTQSSVLITHALHLLAVLEYDGTEFVGFQRQKRGRSVQEEFERALGEFGDQPVRIVGGGRTDAGVHATGQTASFKIEWTRDLETLQRALNAKLPRDLAVKSVRPVPDGFSARYSALSRTYRYAVLNQPVRSPLQERYALWMAGPLDVEAMAVAARQLVGMHDFGAFGTPPRGDNTVRELIRAEVWRERATIHFEFEANAFLYRMVRRLVGTLLQIGSGKLDLKGLACVLQRKCRAGDAVPPHGLTLIQVKYDL